MNYLDHKVRGKQRGTTLIEILVSVVVFSVGLSGSAALVLNNVRTTASAATRSQAIILADQLAESMRANLAAYEAADFREDPSPTESVCRSEVKCTFAEQAQYDASVWKAEVASLLPTGQAFVCTDSTPDDGIPGELACDGMGTNVIKIFWTNTRFTNESQVESSNIRRLVLPVVP